MFESIKKRDGRCLAFDALKITEAVARAGKATGEFDEREARKLTLRVLTLAHEMGLDSVPEVEEIQDIVERVLLASPFYKTAKAYILYREQHTQIRNIVSKASVDLVERYLHKMDWKVQENSNMSYSLQGLNNYLSADITSEYWLNRIYPPAIRKAHKGGDLHIHDLSLLSVYCVGWDLKDILIQGFRGVEGKIESAPPRHFRSALGQIVNFFYTLQGEAAGAQAISNFDTLLAPFVRGDGLDYLEVKQALQEFVFNINIPTRVGFQTPFTNITMDLHVPGMMKDLPVILGGKECEETYSDFQDEMNVINRAFAEVMMEGDAKGRVFTFPIPTYNITADFDWENPNLDMIWRMTGKYGIPYFSNFVNSDMSPEDARSMCCRLRLDNRELLKRGGGLFGANPLTGSIGVVTINLPRIGYAAETKEGFLEQLGHMVRLAVESLSIKRKVLEKFTSENLYPYSNFYLREIKRGFGLYWKNHFSTIGIIGMNEACLNFLNEDEYGKGAAPFYTNSTQLPVNYTDDIFKNLMLQDDLQTKYTGGTVLHVYLGEEVTDIGAIKGLVKKIVTNFRLPYFTLTPTFSVCPAHGYLKGEQETCHICHGDTEIYSRVVGYLRPVKQWNNGKQAEFSLRKMYKVA